MQQHDTQTPRTAWKLGQWLGHRYRALLRQEARFAGWLVGQGVPVKVARWLPLTVKIAAGLVLLYVTFWLAVILIGLVIWAHLSNSAIAQQEWEVPDPDEHMKNPGYHPINYDDPPDSSYYDPRYDDD
ncbi:hypothetical protein PEC730217_06080 [Pectobacterium carotovorum subsp. carotovorum]|nr:hypothetical protein PEC730217_06080 [Pectobacterium carotovorum subsp. carotovorum]